MDYASRRQFLASSVPLSAAAAFGQSSVQENTNPGTTDWQLTRVRINDGKYRTTLIEGYASHQSIKAGESLTFFVSTKPERQFTIDVYRLGYYDGKGGRHMTQLGPFDGRSQPTPEMKPENRLRECQWEPSAQLTIPDDWPSGVYLGKLTTDGVLEREGPIQEDPGK
ncbi:MAG: N,N-dimethylformamidase beta subunit family domain-containing protein, partial [Verrucomicrobiota bacterium]